MCDWTVQCTNAAFCAVTGGECFTLSWELQDSGLKGIAASWAGGENPTPPRHPVIVWLSLGVSGFSSPDLSFLICQSSLGLDSL